ncbi:PAS domain-containing sensor histidine kinase [Luteibacter sp. 22Crub2.1]|uniref:two-component system sensor histidine kinase NtrB n=1 Tax=Luteibacter sp. 22Crub2.1 TaxID=1283288 RepID=UPI0009A7C88A|nr:PAS domain-containing sensor histidine kinase [Luteibacter sp. 22Crub2.1]SKC01742.1 PAS domain S-box-containing protein [Luteibacter sp. 22Crub2.1]
MTSEDGLYRQFVEASADCMKELDRHGVIRFIAGMGSSALTSEEPERLIGTRWVDLWPPEAHAMVTRVLDRALSGERVDFVAPRPSATGASRWWEVMVAGVVADDRLDHLVVISRDVTERVELQAAIESINELLQERLNETVARSATASSRYGSLLERFESEHGARRDAENRLAGVSEQLAMATHARDLAEASARQAQKQQAVGQLVSGIAHDFNNMLQTVIVSLSGLEDDAADLLPRHRRMLTYAMEGARHATALTRRLLAFARNHPYQAEPVDIGVLVEGFADFARHALGGRVGIEVLRQPAPLPALLDRQGLEQALMNVCLNARDAMEGFGTVVIEVGERRGDPVSASAMRDSETPRQVFITVADTGGGMSEEVRHRLFEPYFTTKPGGSGLGLAQVYGTVAQAGGGVEIESDAGIGTRIRLVFPHYAGPLESGG